MPSDRATASTLRDRLLQEAEIEAERIVAVLRVVVTAMLAVVLVLSLLSLPGSPPATVHRAVAVAFAILLVYLLLGLVSYRLARPDRLRPWMPWVFTTADGGLLLFNVAFNAYNLDVSVAYAAVFPAAWLAPLTLSLTTLRYRPGLQAYSGALVVSGLVLLGLTEGVRSELPIVPAETFAATPNAMRLAMFTGFAIILVVAARRRRRLLARAIAEVERRSEYQRYLPPAIAQLVAEGEIARLRRGWRTEAAVLLVDIRGFTRLAENLEPEALSGFVTAFRRRVSDCVEAKGGVVDKFVGDGAVVLFGALGDDREAAANALACAVTLGREVRVIDGTPVRLAIGAHWGEVYAGAVGDESRLEFTVLGDTVNVAARLEEVAKSVDRSLVVSSALLEAAEVSTLDAWQRLETSHVRGRAGELALFAPY